MSDGCSTLNVVTFMHAHAGDAATLGGNDHAPYATGSMPARRARVLMSTFPNYLTSGQSFIVQYGRYLRGAPTPLAFAQALVRSHYNSGNPKTGGTADFVPNTIKGIAMVERRRGC